MELKFNRILVKVPLLNEMIFSTFPFFYLLTEEFKEASIFALVEAGDAMAFSFLPHRIKVVERPIHKKNLLETHHFVANCNEIFNIDLFIDLENSFNSSFIGFNFRAPVRVGYELGWNKHLLTHRYLPIQNMNDERCYVNLLESFLNKKYENFKVQHPIGDLQKNEKIEQLFKGPEPSRFILIMLNDFKNVAQDIDVWKSFFDSFEKQKFIIWSRFDEDAISDLFSSIDLNGNEIFIHRGSLSGEMNFIFEKVVGVITNNMWAEGLLAYYNLSAITFVTHERPMSAHHYFKFRPMRVLFKSINEIDYIFRDEMKPLTSMNEVVDLIHFNFKL